MNDYSYLNKLTCFTDIHFHIDGSLSISNIKDLAKLNGVSIPSNDNELRKLIECDPDCHDLVQFLTKFAFPCSLLQTTESLKLATRNILKEAKTDGCMYVELRYAPQLHCQKGMSIEDAVLAVIEGCKNSDIDSSIILCLMRGEGEENYNQNLETILIAKKYLDKGVAGIDIAGAESLYPTSSFEDLFAKARELGIPFTIHAGEADGPESIKQALKFGALRIGHGVRSLEDQLLLDKLKQEQILLEVCPSSNIKTNIFKTFDDVPVKKLLDYGVPVCINTDDKSIIGTNIKNEFVNICKTQKLSKNDVKKLLINSVQYSFCSRARRDYLISKINAEI